MCVQIQYREGRGAHNMWALLEQEVFARWTPTLHSGCDIQDFLKTYDAPDTLLEFVSSTYDSYGFHS